MNLKKSNANAEWFIEAPPQPIGGCFGGCELAITVYNQQVQGNPTFNINKEANGFRIYANVDTDSSPYTGYYLGGEDTGGHYLLGESAEQYTMKFEVKWIPINKLSLRAEPSTIISKVPTTIVLHAVDANNQTPVNGSVQIKNVVVGNTNVPFTYTFNSSALSAKIVAPNYPEAHIAFNINNKLDVTAVPNIVDLSLPDSINITIFATSPATNQPIEGKVLTDEGEKVKPTNEIGPTNTPFLHYFLPHTDGTPQHGFYNSPPEVIVVAPTYDDTRVPIEFINIIQPEQPEGGGNNGDPDDGGDGDGCELSPDERKPECELIVAHKMISEGNFTGAIIHLNLAEQQILALQGNITFFAPSNIIDNKSTMEESLNQINKARNALNDDNIMQAFYNLDLAEKSLLTSTVHMNITTSE